jgi:hypothetical protein
MNSKKDRGAAVSKYKTVLQRVVDNRPSGTRHRLAMALGKNRSFISQITSPAYSVPIPPGHLDTIFEICHFTPAEKSEFLAAYTLAHSRRAGAARKRSDGVTLTVTVPDLGDARANRALAQAIEAMADVLARLAKRNGKPS